MKGKLNEKCLVMWIDENAIGLIDFFVGVLNLEPENYATQWVYYKIIYGILSAPAAHKKRLYCQGICLNKPKQYRS